jgi:hypothetical protein
MINLNRRELKVILRGLTLERESLREEITSDPKWRDRLLDDPEYIDLIRLQEKLLTELDKLSY